MPIDDSTRRKGATALLLRVRVPNGPTTEYYVFEGLTIGRSVGNTIVVDDESTARSHAQVSCDRDANAHSFHLDARDYVVVDGHQVDRVALTPGAKFRIGQHEFLCVVESAVSESLDEPEVHDSDAEYHPSAVAAPNDSTIVASAASASTTSAQTRSRSSILLQFLLDHSQTLAISCVMLLALGHILVTWVRVAAHEERAREAEIRGDLDRAIAELTAALKINSQVADLWRSRGRMLVKKGDYRNARNDFSAALELRPDDAWTLSMRGMCRLHLGELDAAIADCDASIAMSNQDHWPYWHRGLAWREKNDHTRALNDFTECVQRNPQFAEAYAERAVIQGNAGDPDSAIQDLETVLRLEPAHKRAHYLLAAVWFEKDAWKALEYLEEAARRDPESIEVKQLAEAIAKKTEKPWWRLW